MATRPNIPDGFIGGQPRMGETKLQVESHKKGEFKVSGDNSVKIKLKAEIPVKVVTKLTQCDGDKDLQGHVLSQREKGRVTLQVAFPDNGFYKLQIFALPESDPNEQLPGVYNYLIEVEKNYKKIVPYVKVYTKFYTDYCFLAKPKFLDTDSPKLDKVKFEVKVPSAKKVAVHAGEEWFQLTKKGTDDWEGTADLKKYAGQNTKVTVNGSYDDAGTSYSVLLDYVI